MARYLTATEAKFEASFEAMESKHEAEVRDLSDQLREINAELAETKTELAESKPETPDRRSEKDVSRAVERNSDTPLSGPAGIDSRSTTSDEQRNEADRPTEKRRLPSSGTLGVGSAVISEIVNVASHVQPTSASILSHIPAAIGIGVAVVGAVRERRKSKDAN